MGNCVSSMNNDNDEDDTGGLGWAALRRAVQAGDRDKCRDLIEGATGWAPIALAARRDELEIVRFLVKNVIYLIDRKDVEYNNDGDDDDDDYDGSSYSLDEKYINVRDNSYYGCTAIMHAARNGNLKMMKVLIDARADVNKHDSYGWTPVMEAVSGGRFDIVRMLSDAGADINKQSKNGLTAVMWAAKMGNLEIVRFLIEVGANIHLKNRYGWTA